MTVNPLRAQLRFFGLVAGWYAKPEDDPLHDATGDGWNSRMAELRWRTLDPQPDPLPSRILCHGLIQGVKWRGKDVSYPVQDTSNPEARIVLGNNVVEALTAYLVGSNGNQDGARHGRTELLEAFQFDVLATVEQAGGHHELTASLHERTLDPSPGGTRWEIGESSRPGNGTAAGKDRAAATAGPDRSGKETATVVPETVHRALRKLNHAQRRLDGADRELRSYQGEIYATWYLAMLDASRPKAGRADELRNRVAWLRTSSDQVRRSLGEAATLRDRGRKELEDVLKIHLPGFEVQAGNEPYFHAPNDPVVLIGGGVARAPKRHGEDGRYSRDGKTLLCRHEDQAISRWMVRVPTEAQLQSITAELLGSTDFPRDPAACAIPGAIEAKLLPEALLLEPELTPRFARSLSGGRLADLWKPTLDRALDRLHEESRKPEKDGVPGAIRITLPPYRDDDAENRKGWPIDVETPGSGDGLIQLEPPMRFPSAVALNRWREGKNPWLPLYLVWEVKWRPSASEPAEIFKIWTLDVAEHRFTRGQDRGNAEVSYSGYTLLTPGATVNLAIRLKERLDAAPSDWLRGVFENVLQADVLTASLSGFTERLVMKRRHPELPLLDPEDPKKRGTAREIKGIEAGTIGEDLKRDRAAPGTDPGTGTSPGPRDRGGGARPVRLTRWDESIPRIAPVPRDRSDGAFFPVRAGSLEVVRLCVVDAFGRMSELSIDDTMRGSPRLQRESRPKDSPRFHLEPRLASPARVAMQWGSPIDPGEPAVCGWLLPNILDRSFVVLDHHGRSLGMLQRRLPGAPSGGPGRSGKAFAWVPVPPMKRPEDPTDPLPGGNECLRGFLKALLSQRGEGGAAYDRLFAGLETTQAAVNRPPSARSPNLAALLGRPLALVRASLRLEPAGLGPLAQGWDSVNKLDVREAMLGLAEVGFPVVLGHPVPGLDGLVGFFVLDHPTAASDGSYDRLYMACGLQGIDSRYVKYFNEKEVKYFNDKEDITPRIFLADPLELLLLMYPEAGVTVTTGILPRQTFRPESADGGADLDESDVYFFTGPVVSPEGELRIPQPSDAYGQWSWTHRQKIDDWGSEQRLEGRDRETDQPFQDALGIREGWLKLVTHPLSIQGFRVEGVSPSGAQTGAPEFKLSSDQQYVLAWSVSGADGIALTRGNESRPLFKSEAPPHPTRYAIGKPSPATATYSLAAWRGDSRCEPAVIRLTCSG